MRLFCEFEAFDGLLWEFEYFLWLWVFESELNLRGLKWRVF
ncbi:hypothetical protein [Campylobacter troglodytis]|nr:hypothetical protein [Campylobacter troglodytis]